MSASWNYPFGLALDLVVTEIAAGNSSLLKPTSAAPLVDALFERLVREAFPVSPGLIQVLHGPARVGGLLAGAPGVDYFAFTRSTKIGRELQATLAPLRQPTLMEQVTEKEDPPFIAREGQALFLAD